MADIDINICLLNENFQPGYNKAPDWVAKHNKNIYTVLDYIDPGIKAKTSTDVSKSQFNSRPADFLHRYLEIRNDGEDRVVISKFIYGCNRDFECYSPFDELELLVKYKLYLEKHTPFECGLYVKHY